MTTNATPGALGSNDQLGPAVEQALYSLIATADDESDDGNRDRAKLLHACASTLGAELRRLRAAIVRADLQMGDGHIDAARRTLDDAMDGPNVGAKRGPTA